MKQIQTVMFKIYKLTISPIMVLLFGKGCIYQPTCSCYADEAISRHGFIYGSALAVRRVFRCHPYAKGGYDPVPRKLKAQSLKPKAMKNMTKVLLHKPQKLAFSFKHFALSLKL